MSGRAVTGCLFSLWVVASPGRATAQTTSAITGTYSQVAAGANSALALRDDGLLWSWGMNSGGQLGDGTRMQRTRPVLVTTPASVAAGTRWTQVASGGNTAFAIRSDGSLWAWGSNDYYGQLGLGVTPTTQTSTDVLVPTPVPTPAAATAGTVWTQVACSGGHTLAIRSDGTLWSWGNNSGGQLGLGVAASFVTSPQLVPVPTGAATGTTWSSCAAGGTASYAIRSDGTLWSWGKPLYSFSTLGHPSPAAGTFTPELVPTPTGAAAGTRWATVAAGLGDTHVLATRSDGTLWAWGMDNQGQFGMGNAGPANGGSTVPLAVPVPVGATAGATWRRAAVGNGASLGLLSDNTLWGWGNNYDGVLGLNVQPPDAALPTQEYNREVWSSMVMGGWHSLGISRGRVLVTGRGSNGQLGLGDQQTFLSLFVQIAALPLPARTGAAVSGSAYPNPVSGGAAVRVPGLPAGTKLTLRSLHGQLISTARLGPLGEWQVPALPPGIYLLGAEGETAPAFVTRLVLE